MSVSVAVIYRLICNRLLEPGGLTGASGVTSADFLELLADTVRDFMQKTEILRDVELIRAVEDTGDYALQSSAIAPHACYYDQEQIDRATAADIAWDPQARADVERPNSWHDDRLQQGHIELVPTPQYTGNALSTPAVFADGETNLTVLESVMPELSGLTTASTIAGIPRSFTWYLAYGVLFRVFSGDTLVKDPMRANYCKARFDEGVGIAKTVMGEI